MIAPISLSETERRQTFWATTISNLTNPVLLVVVSGIFITRHFAHNNATPWRYAVLGSVLLLGPGLIYTMYLWIKERQIDFDITRREDRIVPLMLVTLGSLVGGYLIETRVDNQTLLVLSRVLVFMMLSLTILTLVWKVSLHAATLTALVSLIVIYQKPIFGLLYLLLIPVVWARFHLRQHTKAQLLVGSIMGVVITYTAVWLFASS